MNREKTKVYIYTRVSTAMQIDGYSLDAQKSRIDIVLIMLPAHEISKKIRYNQA